jgi:carboxylesterase
LSDIAVLLIHGLGGTPTEMKYVGSRLQQNGYHVEYCKLAGHGQTIEHLKQSKYTDWIESACDAYLKLANKYSVIHVAGLSAGGLIALQVAIRHQCASVLLYSPVLTLDGWAMPVYMKWVSYLRPWMNVYDFNVRERHPYGIKSDRIRQFVTSHMTDNGNEHAGSFYTPFKTMLQFNALARNTKKHLNRVDCPVVTFHSNTDDVASIDNSFYILNNVSGTGYHHTILDSYHLIVIDQQRDYVADITVSEVARLSKPFSIKRYQQTAVA